MPAITNSGKNPLFGTVWEVYQPIDEPADGPGLAPGKVWAIAPGYFWFYRSIKHAGDDQKPFWKGYLEGPDKVNVDPDAGTVTFDTGNPVPSQFQAVVLSDVHIGNNAPTCWYQSAVHDAYLETALNWVVEHKDQVSELVLLGDLLDFWTYLPSEQPPTIQQIIDANPNILGPTGALTRAVAALPGRVSLLLGNHDGTLTQTDIETLSAHVGQIQLVDPVHVLTGRRGAKTVFSHGHLWTMFNAPDDDTPFAPLPVGHFVTRMIAYKAVHALLQPGQTVADLPGWGVPAPWSGAYLWKLLLAGGDVAGALLDLMAANANFSHDDPIILPHGQTTTLTQVKTIYADLFTRWVAKEQGFANAGRAAEADNEGGSYLAWFAQRLAMENDADLVVMGHTHAPIAGMAGSPVIYKNNGYECAAIPDLQGAARFTFTVVDLEFANADIYQVTPGLQYYRVSPLDPPAPQISPVAFPFLNVLMDFSCYVRITNQTNDVLTRGALAAPISGRWIVEPPQTIPPGEWGDFWLQDNVGPWGAEGYVTYNNDLTFRFSCPTTAQILQGTHNFASGPGHDFVAKSGDSGSRGQGGYQPKGVVPLSGHPLQVLFTVSTADAAAASPNFSGTCGQNSSAISVSGLQPGNALLLNNSTQLSGCIQANDGGCVYGITLELGLFEGVYGYRLSIDGQGPSGIASGSMYLAFTDKTGDTYKKSFFASHRQTLTLDYNSQDPAITRIQWGNNAI